MIGNICNDYISIRNNSKTALKLFLSSVIDSVILAIALLSLAISCFHQLSGTIIAFRSELRIDPDVNISFLIVYKGDEVYYENWNTRIWRCRPQTS